ncbi:MAG: hypothetical protein ACREJM_00350, partial [Candidatus Saccharimonadales bacterium]
MERFARVVIGYHGCTRAFARKLLLDEAAIEAWRPSENEWDWLGHGIYFWEHSPARALRWAEEKYGRRGRPAVLGAVIQLGRCFDLFNEAITTVLAKSYADLGAGFAPQHRSLPRNTGREYKLRKLDCLVVNDCLDRLKVDGIEYDTVRAAFWEGEPLYPGASFARETHIQIA